MALKSFWGGVHPRDKKELSANSPIERLDVPAGKELVYLMNQHIGAPATPCVQVGDHVLKGQTIGTASSFVSANIISSVSGTVKEVGSRVDHNGDNSMAIVVENDGLDEKIEGYGSVHDWEKLQKEEILSLIREAGIVGMGGAGFPTHIKLTVKEGVTIDNVICNGAECEPYITCDYRLMIERTELAVTGMRILLKLFPGAKGTFAVENNKGDAIDTLRSQTRKHGRTISVLPLKAKYPQGGERMIIYAVTGRKINSKMLPADAGCIVVNFATLFTIANAVCYGKPLNRRIITVTGDAIRYPSNFDAPIGISVTDLIDAAGGFVQEPEKVISGGPMMGNALYTLDVPVTKTTSCILALAHDEMAQYAPIQCIRCGKCLTVCPQRLMPIKLKNAADAGDYQTFEKLNGLECIGCGCCTYICPSKRKISQSIKIAKLQVISAKKQGRK